VIDGFGLGALPDAGKYGDEGANTLGHLVETVAPEIENMTEMGLLNAAGLPGAVEEPLACFGKMAEVSAGKDTTTGHWEIAGLPVERPFPTYPNGFPPEVIEAFERETGLEVIGNKPASGTAIIEELGPEHLRTGKLIVYTSADSVFRIAAHEDLVPVETLYEYCHQARELLQGEHGVGRIIARPFNGEYPFARTSRRHDYSLVPPAKTVPDILKESGFDVISVGKIFDIFAGQGFTESYPTANNADGMDKTMGIAKRDFNGLCFVNLVDFDMVYGHRNDVGGYARAMTAFDKWLGEFLKELREEDLLIITADHGCDPATPSTDHSREYTPMIAYGKQLKENVNLGTRDSFADIGATVLEWFGVSTDEIYGKSFLKEIIHD
jgi:phosphopentomutase